MSFDDVSQRPRILMLNNEFPPLGGGTASVNAEILACFAAQGDSDVDVITASEGERSQTIRRTDHIRIFRIPVGRKNIHHATYGELIRYAFGALHLARRLSKEAPYTVCLAWSVVPAGAVALALRYFFGLPYVVRVCGPDLPGFETRYRTITGVLRPLLRLVLRGARGVIAKCSEERDLIHALDPQIAVTLIPNGINDTSFYPRGLPRREGPLRLLCVARLIERKGQRLLLAAVQELVRQGADLHLTLVGEGDDEGYLRRLTSQYGIEKSVTFAGYVPREKIAPLYHDADISILLSSNEGMSNALLESLACGLKVITTDVGGMREFQGSGRAILVKRELGSVVQAITEFINAGALASLPSSDSTGVVRSWSEIQRQFAEILR